MLDVGKYELIRNQLYEEYLMAVDAGKLFRDLSKRARHSVEIKLEGDEYTITTTNLSHRAVPPHVIKFKFDEEFYEETADGRQCKSLFTIKDGKVVQTQNCKQGDSIIEHEFQGGWWFVTMKVKDKDIICRRSFQKV